MELHPKLDSFYTSILAYAGLKMDQGVIVNTDEKLKGFSIDDRALTLPYHSNLKNPNGKHIFHPLNENYANAETPTFNLYRDKLAYEINLRLSSAILAIIQTASEVRIQQRAKSSKLIELISGIQETDASSAESFVKIIKASQAKMKESFIVDFYLKKNASIDGTPYSAIGKVNFHLYKELTRTLEEKDDYRVYGSKVRKKDVLSLISILEAIFPDIDQPERYTIGTDHKPFRMFNALLLVTHQVASIVNDLTSLMGELEEPSLCLESAASDLAWVSQIEDIYNLTGEIRAIPNQTSVEAQSHQLKLKEPTVIEPPPTQHTIPQVTTQPPVYSPPQPTQPAMVPPWVQQPTQPQWPQQPQQPSAPQSAEDIIRNGLARERQGYPQPMMQPMQPMGMYPQPMMQPQFNPHPQMQPYGMQPMSMYPQPMMQQPVFQPNSMTPVFQPQPTYFR